MSHDKFVCECVEYCRSACEGLEFYREVEGKKYCVLHCPVQDKESDFNIVLRRKLSSFEYNFRGTYFPAEVSFQSVNFVSYTDFRDVRFSGSSDFHHTTFSDLVTFEDAIFSKDADFTFASFNDMTFFSSALFEAHADFRNTKFSKEINFNNATFNEVIDFRESVFSDKANFIGATLGISANFSMVTFAAATSFHAAILNGDVNFYTAKFEDMVEFYAASFNGTVSFSAAKFIGVVDFSSATFKGLADFNCAFQEGVSFSGTMFGAEVFFNAKIESFMRFIGIVEAPVFAAGASLTLQKAQISKPEQLLFHTARLRPHWFVNVDCRKFEFTNVNWGGFDQSYLPWKEWATLKLSRAWKAWPEYIKHGICSEALHDELQALGESEIENHNRLLSSVCRQLATNAEDNKRYDEAGRFHYASMDARRLEKWRGWNVFTLEWWYWLVSGYGERIPRAANCLLVLLLSFSFLFTQVGFDLKTVSPNTTMAQNIVPASNQPIFEELPLPSFRDGLTYSLSAALFQRPEPKPHSFWAKLCVSLEMIFVPLQAALLALAVRRRFLR